MGSQCLTTRDDSAANIKSSLVGLISRSKMSVLRAQCAARLVPVMRARRVQGFPIPLRSASTNRADRSTEPDPKSEPSDAPAARPGESSMIRQEDSSQAMVDHRPDYHAPVDHGTSYDSLVISILGYPLTIADAFPPYRKESWTVVSQEKLSRQQCFPVRRLSSKHGQFGSHSRKERRQIRR